MAASLRESDPDEALAMADDADTALADYNEAISIEPDLCHCLCEPRPGVGKKTICKEPWRI